jgi:acyl-CoA reductase-like NAD-dependent aldehyde dehydrogenase
VAKPHQPLRLDVRKSYKLFINGEFVRSESGRSDPVSHAPDDFASVARASRHDARGAVEAARGAFAAWSSRAPCERGLALYRLAELTEARRPQFAAHLRLVWKVDDAAALHEATAATDRVLWYAGWCDKYAALVSSQNPVPGPHSCYSAPEPMGVVAVVAPDEPSLLGFVSSVVPALVSGNTVVAVASETDARMAIELAECLATCGLPPGTVNVLTGRRIELAPVLARHADVDALEAHGLDPSFAAELERMGADDLKRTRIVPPLSAGGWYSDVTADLANVTALTETKTIWLPAGG